MKFKPVDLTRIGDELDYIANNEMDKYNPNDNSAEMKIVLPSCDRTVRLKVRFEMLDETRESHIEDITNKANELKELIKRGNIDKIKYHYPVPELEMSRGAPRIHLTNFSSSILSELEVKEIFNSIGIVVSRQKVTKMSRDKGLVPASYLTSDGRYKSNIYTIIITTQPLWNRYD